MICHNAQSLSLFVINSLHENIKVIFKDDVKLDARVKSYNGWHILDA